MTHSDYLLAAGAVMDGLIAKPMGLFESSPSAPLLFPPSQVLHFGFPEFSARRT